MEDVGRFMLVVGGNAGREEGEAWGWRRQVDIALSLSLQVPCALLLQYYTPLSEKAIALVEIRMVRAFISYARFSGQGLIAYVRTYVSYGQKNRIVLGKRRCG